MSTLKSVELGDILPPDCVKKLITFTRDFELGHITFLGDRTPRKVMRDTILAPYHKEIEKMCKQEMNLDHLSWAICYAIHQNTGLDLIQY